MALFSWYELAASREPLFDYAFVVGNSAETLLRALIALAIVAIVTLIFSTSGTIGRTRRATRAR
jgi:hypothetical protein